jgi:Fe2+ or Zn2+ uptake regulation protein
VKTHYYTSEIVDICYWNHLTVEEIYSIIIKKYPEAGKSSIYRNVEDLVEKGNLKKIIWVWKKAYFEKNIWKHIHLIDKNTWEIKDLEESVSITNLPKNFKISEIDIKLFWYNESDNIL